MAVYREGYKAIELISKKSTRIFMDACDYGAPTKKGDEVWNAAKQLCKSYGIEGTRKENRYSTGRSVSQKVTLIDEWAVSDERKTIDQATEVYLVSFVSCDKGKCKGKTGYIYTQRVK